MRSSLKSILRSGSKGQSFVELTLVVIPLMLLLVGIAEYGFLLNRYLNLLDAAREAARFNANYNPFCSPASTDPSCPPGTVTDAYYANTALEAVHVMSPLVMNPQAGDDIVVSFFKVSGGVIEQRYPDTSGENGWSWSEHAAGYLTRNHVSQQTSAFITSRMDATAPDVSVALVEIYYNYPQTLKNPIFERLFGDTIPVYTYTIMPIKNVTIPTSP